MVAGVIEPTTGKVLINGKDMSDVLVEDRDIGYVFQNIALFPHMNALDNVSYGPRVKGLTSKEIEEIPKILPYDGQAA